MLSKGNIFISYLFFGGSRVLGPAAACRNQPFAVASLEQDHPAWTVATFRIIIKQ